MELEFTQGAFADEYVPAPLKPEGFDAEVDRITHGFGRVEWGCDLFTFRNDNPKAVKYPWGRFGISRWIYEVWTPAFCTEDEWNAARYRFFANTELIDWNDPALPANPQAQEKYLEYLGLGKLVDMAGPYPHEGIWGMKMPLVDMSPNNFGGYVPCSRDFLEWLRLNDYAWRTGPQGKQASLEAYNRMMDELDAEEKLRLAETEQRAEKHSEWVHAHEAEINAAPTRSQFILTPDGQPWRKHADISTNA